MPPEYFIASRHLERLEVGPGKTTFVSGVLCGLLMIAVTRRASRKPASRSAMSHRDNLRYPLPCRRRRWLRIRRRLQPAKRAGRWKAVRPPEFRSDRTHLPAESSTNSKDWSGDNRSRWE